MKDNFKNAICFDFDTKKSKEVGFSNIYVTLQKFLENEGFEKFVRGTNYISDKNQVEITLSLQRLFSVYPKMKSCIKDLKLVRIDEVVDLMIIEAKNCTKSDCDEYVGVY